MKILQASSNTLNYIQLFALTLVIVGYPYIEISYINASISVVFFYVFSILGVSLTLHRFYSHKNFEFKNEFLRKAFTLIALLSGRGSPLGWVYIHRLHHRSADTDDDPHGPKTIGFKIFGFKPKGADEKMQVFLVKEMMTKEHLFMHNYYLGFIIAYALILGLVNFEWLYFSYALPLLMVQFSQNCFNYFAHKYGYRNHDTRDDSTNNAWLWPLIMGDAWHNNHHKNLAKFSTKENWWEFDPVVAIAGVLKK